MDKLLIKICYNLYNYLKNQKIWEWINVYKEMIKNDYNNMLQAEWPWFYFEFLFFDFLKKNNISEIKKNNIKIWFDLLLFWEKYGDLKTSNNQSNSIIGNNIKFIKPLLDNNQELYYIVLFFKVEMDKENDYEVTTFWNTQINLIKNKNKRLHSYGNRMKNKVFLEELLLLKIDNKNKIFLKDFHQWINSNWKKRNKKILINKKDINNFILFHKKF